jgi:hypothetical protein
MNHHRLTLGALAGGFAIMLGMPVRAQVAGLAGLRGNVPIPVGPFDLSISGSTDRLASQTLPRTLYTFEMTARRRIGSGGLWFGSALEGTREVDSLPVRPLLRLGFWQSYKAIRVSIDAATHATRLGGHPSTLSSVVVSPGDSSFDTLSHTWTYRPPDRQTVGDSGAPSRVALWSELQGRVAWQLGNASVAALVGARGQVGVFRPNVWTRISAAYPFAQHFSLVGAAGTEPPRIGLGVPATHVASLAVNITPWHSTKSFAGDDNAIHGFVVRSNGARHYTATFRAIDAKSVELSGDFAGWRPASLTQVQAGLWQMDIVASPGTYHVNLRVNGGHWFAPPGLPEAQDDFNGMVGILVLR